MDERGVDYGCGHPNHGNLLHNCEPEMRRLLAEAAAGRAAVEAVARVRALADELAAKCPPDDWGSGDIGDAVAADVGRAFRSALDGEA